MILKDCEKRDQSKSPENLGMFTGSGSVCQAVTLCREPCDKSFGNYSMVQVDLVANFMALLRLGDVGGQGLNFLKTIQQASYKYSRYAPVVSFINQ